MTEVTLQTYESQIDQMIEEARYLEGLAHLRHILKAYPRYIGAYYLLGKMMLDVDLPTLAVDMFQRVLTADPEHLLARIGLGIAHDKLGNLPAALWNLERAYEIDSSNVDLADEICQLRAKQSGVEPSHVPLTRASLARLYVRGHLYNRAVEELRTLLKEQPQRIDLQVALAEAYWRNDQIVQASDLCQQILDSTPYGLKPNLLLGTLWLNSGQEEGKRYLNRAQEIDPKNQLSAELFGKDSLLPEQEITVERLAYNPGAVTLDKDSEWFKHLEAASVTVGISEAVPEMSDSEMRLVDITADLESQIQVPDWLSEMGVMSSEAQAGGREAGELEAEELSSLFDTTTGFKAPEEAEEEAEVPDWLQELEPTGGEAATTEEEVPDWLQELEPEGAPSAGVEGEVPDWLQELEPEAEEVAAPKTAEEAEVPDWLQEMAPPEGPAAEAAFAAGSTEEVPGWLQELEPESAPSTDVEGEVPDWLQELEPAGATAEAAPAEQPEEEAPDWLGTLEPAAESVEEALPEGDEELLDWFQELESDEVVAEGPPSEEEEEEGLPEWLEAGLESTEAIREEVEPEITAPEEIPDWVQGLKPTEEAPAEAEAEAVAEGEVPDWLQELEPPEESSEEAMAVAAEVPDWLKEIAPPAPAEAPEKTKTEEEAAPDWLQELALAEAPEAEAEGEETEVLPEWLEEIEEPTLEGVSFEAEEDDLQVTAAPAPAEHPTETAAPAMFGWTSFPPTGSEEGVEVDERAEEEAVPDWVQELQPPAEAPSPEAGGMFGWTSFSPEGEPEALEAGAEKVPDWLKELQLPETPQAAAETGIVPEGGMLSGDEALSWLESLAAGKEEELRAQAEAEAKARVDEIMGRKPAEAAPAAEPPATEVPEEGIEEETEVAEEIAEAEPPAPEGEMLSGDDALAWLESLTVGKEDELRAQAETEAKARVAEIMGRQPEAEPKEAAPAEEAPVAEIPEKPAEEEVAVSEEAVAEAAVAPAPPAPEGEMLSGDDALAWLESLTVGKEDELRAQAETEAKARVAEIMGRQPETKPKEAEAAPREAAPLAEMPEKPTEEESEIVIKTKPKVKSDRVTASLVPEGEMLSGDDALAWLESFAAGKEDELRAQAEIEAKARVAEIMGRQPESKPAEAEPLEEAPVAGIPEKDSEEEAEIVEAQTEIELPEVKKEAPIEIGEAALATTEAPKEEPAAPVEIHEPPAEEELYFGEEAPLTKVPETTAHPSAEELYFGEEAPVSAPKKKAKPAPVAPAFSTQNLDEGRAYLKKRRSDHASRLKFARALWKAGELEESLDHYSKLIRSGQMMDEVIDDLKAYSKAKPKAPLVLRVLGDAYMKQGLLDTAMDLYKQAMDLL